MYVIIYSQKKKKKKKKKKNFLSNFPRCLHSAKLEKVPATTKSEPDLDMALSKEGNDSQDLHQSEGSDPPPEDPCNPFKNSLSEPVFIKAPLLGILEHAPAARIVWSKPLTMTAIFPLTRADLGDVWTQVDDLAVIQVSVVQGGWPAAATLFIHYVDYPEFYLRSIMSVLRTQTFMDGTPLKWAKVETNV